MKFLNSTIRSLGFVQLENEEQLKGVFVVTVFFFLFLGGEWDWRWGRYRPKGALTMQDSWLTLTNIHFCLQVWRAKKPPKYLVRQLCLLSWPKYEKRRIPLCIKENIVMRLLFINISLTAAYQSFYKDLAGEESRKVPFLPSVHAFLEQES